MHGQVEAFSKNKEHLGAIGQQTNKLYKPAKIGLIFSRVKNEKKFCYLTMQTKYRR
jgi:hypothetical protein